MLLATLIAGCDANLEVVTSGALINCVTTPNDPSCQPTIEDFKAEKADLDGTAETLTVAWSHSSYLENGTVILATQKDCTGQAAVFDQASGASVSVLQIPDGDLLRVREFRKKRSAL